ncbi:hypothetical protein OSB04_026412 [Centaurea solstitialis]|uniref:C2H2-type domain-containing protein n=1 Tax=Centaurea solstitialis TaxID=347529 RepID=A0AA38SNX6_9ASTR|nr:hypothetical protein OSB04_026412 [Centaurea solstitialis]
MEEYSQYLMLVKSKNNKILMDPLSWEEQAFAQDARGPLGGFVWPPRSYSCSFCRREFRSAQALGGHMNVHRRERAKLKHTVNGSTTTSAPISTTTTTIITPQNHNKQRAKCLIPALGQESLDSNSDTKSCVYDEVLVVADHGNGEVETNLFLGFELDSSSNTTSGYKRQKTAVTRSAPVNVAGSVKGLDLELRLAS